MSIPIPARGQLVDSGGNILAIGVLHAWFNASEQMSGVPAGGSTAAMIMLTLAVMVIARCLAILSPAGLPQRGRRPSDHARAPSLSGR